MFKLLAGKSLLSLATPVAIASTLTLSSEFKTALFGGSKPEAKKDTVEFTKTFIWGNGHYQARPDGAMAFKNFEPKLISNFGGKGKPNLQTVVFGLANEAGISETGKIYIWKKHELASSKDKSINDNERQNIQELEVPGGARQIAFTKEFLWALNNNGDVFQFKCSPGQPAEKNCRKVESLTKVKELAVGEDHFAALTQGGEVYMMGDDTHGQCGQGAKNRKTSPPFYTKRVKAPKRIENVENVKKIICGGNHTLALTQEGSVYGWGSNSALQLSHEVEFASVADPLLAVYSPVRLDNLVPNNEVTDIAAGKEFTIFVTKNKSNNETELYGFGYNLTGELGAGNVRHVTDVIKIEPLSNYKITNPEGKEEDVSIKQISCGKNHCMALLNIGAVMEWGANEFGQLGNKKRAYSENPIILSDFVKEKVVKVSCGYDNSAVITEDIVSPTK